MKCPRCSQALRQVSYEGVLVDTCDGCHGEWLDKAEITRINKARDVVFSAEDKANVEGSKQVVLKQVVQAQKALICPRCNVAMSTINYAYDSGVMIDQCSKCAGVWLDDQELEAIQMVVEAWESRDGAIRAKFAPVLKNIQSQTAVSIAQSSGGGTKGSLVKAIVYNLF
jgi:uncharacterized protein